MIRAGSRDDVGSSVLLMGLPRFRIRSLLIATALVAAVLAASIEAERAPRLAITVCIVVPAIAIGMWKQL